MKWIDREKKDNMEYIKRFLEEKIIGEETRQIVKKIDYEASFIFIVCICIISISKQ